MSVELAAQIKEKLAKGFYPSDVFSKFEILLTKTGNSEELSTGNPDVQVVSSSVRNDVKEKVNELAKQGYRLGLINKEAAVMYRYDQTTPPLTYVWLRVSDKSVEKKLATLQESGAVYRMAYTDDSDIKDQIVFEQGVDADRQRSEYIVLKFEFQVIENGAVRRRSSGSGEARIALSPASKEMVKLLNSLAKEGFRVRDLFVSNSVSDKVSVLLERSL